MKKALLTGIAALFLATGTAHAMDHDLSDTWCAKHSRENENDRVGLADQVAEASFPDLATGDAFAIDETFEAARIKRRCELIGEVEVFATVGDKDAKLAPVGRVGSARLLRSYITGFRRNRAGYVIRDVCHCAPLPLYWILAHRAPCVGGPAMRRGGLFRGRITPLEPLDFCPSCPA